MSGVRSRTAIITGVALVAVIAVLVFGSAAVTQARHVASALRGGEVQPAAARTELACEAHSNPVCNPDPVEVATVMASFPMSKPPGAHPTYLTEGEAVTRARGAGGAPESAAAYARFMTHAQWESLDGGRSSTINPQRMVWAVTVHADVWTTGSLVAPPVLKHVYTVVIDAETGIIAEACVGCDTIQ